MNADNANKTKELSGVPAAEATPDHAQRSSLEPPGVRRNPTTIRLTLRMLARLDRVSRELDRPKSQLIREAIDALLARYERRLG